MSRASSPLRGEVWLADLDPTFGHEQGGRRPVLVVSTDAFNAAPAGLVVILPITSRLRPVVFHVPIDPPEGGLRRPSVVLCDAVRSVDQRRLISRWGAADAATMDVVADRLRLLMGL